MGEKILGVIGTSFPFVAVISSHIDQIKDVLQIANLVVGCAVGLVSLWGLLRSKR